MPGRRYPSRRRVSTNGGANPASGFLVLSQSAISVAGVAGDPAFAIEDTIVLTNGGAGPWSGAPSLGVAYSGTSGWLNIAVNTGGGAVTYSFSVDTSILAEGTETATLTFTDALCSNSPVQATITVEVTDPAPTISLVPSVVSINLVDEAVGTDVVVTVTNVGQGAMATPTIGSITGTGAAYVGTPVVAGSGPWTVTITPDATGGTVGTYQAVIPVVSTGADNTPQNITANITVTAAAQAFLALDATLDDRTGQVGEADPLDLVVNARSTTSTPLAGPTVGSITYSGDHSDFVSASVVGNAITCTFDTSGISTSGTTIATVPVSDSAASNTVNYQIYLKMGSPPATAALGVSPSAISRSPTEGTNAQAYPFSVVNNGTGGLPGLGTVTVSLSPGVSWANASYTPATGAGTVTFNSAALSPGTYSTSLIVSSTLAINSPTTVPVQIQVQAASGASYPTPPYDLPSFASWNASTDETTGQPFTPADLADYTGTVRNVASQAQLQTAFNNCVDTDIIRITAPFTITSSVTFPDRSFSGIGVLMIDDATYATISALTRRVVASDFANANTITDAALGGGTAGVSGIQAARGASKLRMVGVHIRNGYNLPSTAGKYAMLSWYPSQAPTATSHECSRLHVDRCYFENPWTPGSDYFCTRGVVLGGTENIVEKSRIEGFVNGTAQDSQAIWVPTNSSGKNLIEDNFLEGAAENILIGGTSGLMGAGINYASDVLIRRNHLFKRTAWFTEGVRPWNASGSPVARQLKNLGEQKSGSRVMWEANVFENFDGFLSGQYDPTGGQAYDWTVAGKPQTQADIGRVVCQHIHLRNCMFIAGAGKFNVANAASDTGLSYVDSTKFVQVHNCWWTQTLAGQTTENRMLLSGGSGTVRRLEGFLMSNVTADCGNNFLLFSGLSNGAYPGLSVTDCVASGNLAFWGVSAQGSTNGDVSLNNNCGAGLWTWAGNVAWGSNQGSRPKWSGTFVAADNLQPTSQPTLDANGTLTGPTPAMTAGVSGGRPGVDGAHLATMVAGVRE